MKPLGRREPGLRQRTPYQPRSERTTVISLPCSTKPITRKEVPAPARTLARAAVTTTDVAWARAGRAA